MSAQDLSNACEAAGYPIPRSTVANIESGRKETVSLQELLVIGRVLNIPPITLIYSPYDAAKEVNLTPSDALLSVDAAEEFGFIAGSGASDLGSLHESTLSLRGLEKAAYHSLRAARALLSGEGDASPFSPGLSPRELMEQATLETERVKQEAESFKKVAYQTVRRAFKRRRDLELANISLWEAPGELRDIYEKVRMENESDSEGAL